MRLLLIHRYFWPDTPPYASMLRTIAGHLADGGHRVRVLTARPTRGAGEHGRRVPRREVLDGFAVERLPAVREAGGGPRQLANLVLFPALVATRVLFGRRADLVMCSTAPQVTMGYAVSLAARARRAAFVYHCMDLHPEIGRLSGEFANPLVYRALARMDRSTMRRASAVVVLSEDMRRSVLDRDPALAPKVVVLNNFDLPERSEPGPAPLPPAEPGVVRVVFTGNLGRFQGLEDAVAAVAALPRDVGVELVLMGQGRARADLEAAARRLPEGTSRVVLLPHGSVADARALMRSAHVGLVSLMPEVVRYAFPSKTSTYAAESLALLVVAEPDSELATTVRRRGLGWAVAPGDVDGLREALVDAARWVSDPAATTTTRADIAAYADGLSQQALLPRWADLVADVLRREQGVA